jgi:carbamoyltransferase
MTDSVWGLHFGHDASAVEMSEHGVVRFLNKERVSRVKHALGLGLEDLHSILSGARDGALIGLSSTQNVPIFHDDSITLTLTDAKPASGADFFGRLPEDHPYHAYARWHKDPRGQSGLVITENMFSYETAQNAGSSRSYEALSMAAAAGDTPASALLAKHGAMSLDGRTFRARFYQHHLLHAFYAAYALSADRPALIVTGDGGVGPSYFGGGVYFWSPPNRMVAVAPVDGWLGEFYTLVSMRLGFDEGGGPGKLMGLAPYGRPIHLDGALIGTRRQVTHDDELSMDAVVYRWLERCGVKQDALADWDRRNSAAPPALIADVAASAQAILETNVVRTVRAALSMATRSGFAPDAILLCGGLALNCPANSDVFATAGIPVLIPPAVSDEGLSIGAAAAAFMDEHGRMPAPPSTFADAVYLGSAPTAEDVADAAERHRFVRIATDAAALAAAIERLAKGGVVAMLSGRSEIGPRALGRRSLLADPRNPDTWRKLNGVKRRELWRPFAPAVLFDASPALFDRGPDFSPYMLFNYRCLTKDLPAITHFDHTARLQHVREETGLLFHLLSAWQAAGCGPVLLNTSFNGPGTPIVETAEDGFAEANAIGVTDILTDFGLYQRASEKD